MFLILAIFLMFSVLGISVFQHELVHVTINQKAGAESEMKVFLKDGYLPAVATIPLNEPTKEITEIEKLHLQNEIINYNLSTPLIGIIMMLFLGFLYIGEKVSKE